MTNRQLITEDQIVVVLDTSVARQLAYEGPAPWVDTFADMVRDGYSFSLADATAAELLIQVRENRTQASKHQQMMCALSRFLNPDLPVLPGRIDLHAMIGCSSEPVDLRETAFLAQEAWRQLCDPWGPTAVDGESLEQIRDGERREWREWLDRVARVVELYWIDLSASAPGDVAEHLASFAAQHVDKCYCATDPPMSVRQHLEMRHRFRQMARTRLPKGAYNPSSAKKKNDGVDVDFYQYLILPAFVLTIDGGFFDALQGIESFQRTWFLRPDALAASWNRGERPQPTWPRDPIQCSGADDDPSAIGTDG